METMKSSESSSEEVVDLESMLLAKYRPLLGGRVKSITTGGAPTNPEVVRFLNRCFQCAVFESYGATEVGGIAADGRGNPVLTSP